MIEVVSVTHVRMKPASCRRDDGVREPSDPPATVNVDRIATLRPGIASRDAHLRLGHVDRSRPLGRDFQQLPQSRPFDSTSRDRKPFSLRPLSGNIPSQSGNSNRSMARFVAASPIPSAHPSGTLASGVPTQPTPRHNKPVDATASSSVVQSTSAAPPHHL